MQKRLRALVLLATIVGFTHGPTSATVVYDNGATGPYDGSTISDPDPFPGSLPVFTGAPFRIVAGNNVVTDIRWAGFYFRGNTPDIDNFTLQLFHDDASGRPQTAPFLSMPISAHSRADTGLDFVFNPFDVYRYFAHVDPIVLDPGTLYWISIFNDTSSDADDTWVWASDFGFGNGSVFRFSQTGSWNFTPGTRLDFVLLAVPEPGIVFLSALALTALVLTVRRRMVYRAALRERFPFGAAG